MFKGNLIMFLDLRGSCDQNKNKSQEKKLSHYGLRNLKVQLVLAPGSANNIKQIKDYGTF